ncbi:thioredoxin family protein [Subtercola boreus]|uniref:Thioredoxin family protein n=1 Tax=Subtercola boreus TaxID=120213 RepID=A0A3E0VA53_9MICO|nr:thioredoxin family protein [Subtercola boreus]RFA06561.1 thioredoxin family protein [Subtercola boreus]
MEITLQYFDGCPNWTVAAARLADLAQDRPGLTVRPFLVETVEQARAIGFRGSPSMLVNGADLFPDPDALVGLACRIYVTPEGLAGAPTVEQLRSALAAA